MRANSTAGHKGNAVVNEMRGMLGAHRTNAVVHSSHNQHAGHSAIMFRDKFWLSLALTLPVVLWSAEVQHWLGYHAPVFPGSRFVPAILGTIIFVYGGRIFIQGARQCCRRRLEPSIRRRCHNSEGRCAACGTTQCLAEAHLYMHGPGLVARCPACEHVLLRLVNVRGHMFLDVRGMTHLCLDASGSQ